MYIYMYIYIHLLILQCNWHWSTSNRDNDRPIQALQGGMKAGNKLKGLEVNPAARCFGN